MHIDRDNHVTATANNVERVAEDVRMTYLSKTFGVGRFSLDVRNTHGLEPDCKLPVNTIV
jgi:hypothetical protein